MNGGLPGGGPPFCIGEKGALRRCGSVGAKGPFALVDGTIVPCAARNNRVSLDVAPSGAERERLGARLCRRAALLGNGVEIRPVYKRMYTNRS